MAPIGDRDLAVRPYGLDDSFRGALAERCDFAAFGAKVRRSWELNRKLNAGTFTPELGPVIDQVQDLALGYELSGAGGGGYLYIVAKDPEAAGRIRRRLETSPPNRRARFVKMSVSRAGLKVSRS